MKDKQQKTFYDFKDFSKYTIYHQLGMLQAQRRQLFNELIENLSKYHDLDDKKRLCKVYMYETKHIDEKLREIRNLMNRNESFKNL